MAAQIVAIMDRYGNLRDVENYSREEAIEILGKEAGTKLNPDIYKICCKISRQLC